MKHVNKIQFFTMDMYNPVAPSARSPQPKPEKLHTHLSEVQNEASVGPESRSRHCAHHAQGARNGVCDVYMHVACGIHMHRTLLCMLAAETKAKLAAETALKVLVDDD